MGLGRCLLALCVLAGCWVEDRQICHYQDSAEDSCTCTRTCEGMTAPYTFTRCVSEDRETPEVMCQQSCPGATCQGCTCSSSGTCVATICGKATDDEVSAVGLDGAPAVPGH